MLQTHMYGQAIVGYVPKRGTSYSSNERKAYDDPRSYPNAETI